MKTNSNTYFGRNTSMYTSNNPQRATFRHEHSSEGKNFAPTCELISLHSNNFFFLVHI